MCQTRHWVGSSQWKYPGSTLIYSNVTRNNTVAVTAWIHPNPNATDYFFNNVLYQNLQQDVDQDGSGGGATVYYNNTFNPSSCVGAAGQATFINNLWITSSGSSGACRGTTETYFVALTPAAATNAGYLALNAFVPTS